jgi:hypothetical protein
VFQERQAGFLFGIVSESHAVGDFPVERVYRVTDLYARIAPHRTQPASALPSS